ncbi:MAG: carbamoyl-phosphate synthase (glutamine-hydrolyzing) large subunit [bacterium]
MLSPKQKKIILLGSGALKIGEAGEFDYSGSQALKALKEEGVYTILINPNIATIQTSKGLADKIYFLPVNAEFVEKIIAKERPDGLLLSFGGQTALNCGLELYRRKVLEKYGVEVLGTPIKSIEATEDRDLFKKKLAEIKVKTAKSEVALNLTDALAVAEQIGYPVLLRSGYSLGGQGSGVAYDKNQLEKIAKTALLHSPQILIEEYLSGWKEIEYEVVRDSAGNTITVCNMENMDPMGIHTGESVVVAPSQTLSNKEYHFLREIALKTINHLQIVGECNIQYALNPHSPEVEYRVIEVNARLSRSSALASKATGYPLAFVACKLAFGHRLADLQNKVTKATCSFFEPALDYIVVKIPRWDMEKFSKADFEIGSSMKSVGEVMAIGRNFEEAFQKANRMIGLDQNGLIASSTKLKQKYPDTNFKIPEDGLNKILGLIRTPNAYRVAAIVEGLRMGVTPQKINEISHINEWFIYKIKNITDLMETLSQAPQIDKPLLAKAKSLGFSDKQIAVLRKKSEEEIEELRKKYEIFPKENRIDTLAAEYPAQTNYLYLTYKDNREIVPVPVDKKIIILGSGVYRIGSSVEFDWCAVSCALTLKKLGYQTVMINNNPETVSTDYDICDKLYFEELSLETVKAICEKENPLGIIVSMGGQESNNLVVKLAAAGVKILGTKAEDINRAEDRYEFSQLLQNLNISQPEWKQLTEIEEIEEFAEKVGYPVLIRPSYVLSGSAMNVALNEKDLRKYLKEATYISREHPIVVSKFITGAKEIEVDAVACRGEVKATVISEHVENAGVHSGDATIVVPPQKIYIETINKIKDIVNATAKALNITGPFNIQFLAKDNEVKVIECNLRASRSFPFSSKITGLDLIELATYAILGYQIPKQPVPLDLDWVGVKAPQFSFFRIKGADPILKVEMASTGEVGCFGENVYEAYLKSIISTGFKLPKNSILLSLGGEKNKIRFLEQAGTLAELGYKIYATQSTGEFLAERGIVSETLYKIHEKKEPNIKTYLENKKIDLVINITDRFFKKEIEDDYMIRRCAIDCNTPLLTDIKASKLFVLALNKLKKGEINLEIKAQEEYFQTTKENDSQPSLFIDK